MSHFEITMSSGTLGVYYSLGNTFSVEVSEEIKVVEVCSLARISMSEHIK